ncbi:MAG: tetratricopeptide repeat protein [Candidatus Margulisbacteria bacterium]|nr:tetratricopeptide repeat protein [Candidatus Margulisiibacteriota bacterium]MBU1617058.1 tetratricopeptide repeat protein [Candidatus Margulisiibacteriota bacterium]MBU1867013.1 tetratricopeptide repeat protein [Candidatus Margulisiibacteriota bacterium]
MSLKTLGLFLLAAYCLLLTALPSIAWRITPELQKELNTKQEAVRANPNDPGTRFDLAITMAYTNNLQDGWNNLKKTVELDPGFKKKGLELYEKKVTEDPGDWRLRFRLAFAYYFNERKREAIRELDNVIKIDPYNVWAYGYLALIYGELGETETAMAATKKGLAIDSNVAALHLLLGEGYNRKGDKWKGFLETMEAVRLRALGY